MAVELWDGAGWVPVGDEEAPTVVARETHSYAIEGDAGTAKTFVPFHVSKRPEESLNLVGVIRRSQGGSATLVVRVNGATAGTGFSGLTTSATKSTSTPAPVALADGDEISIAYTAGSTSGWVAITLLFDRSTPVTAV